MSDRKSMKPVADICEGCKKAIIEGDSFITVVHGRKLRGGEVVDNKYMWHYGCYMAGDGY